MLRLFVWLLVVGSAWAERLPAPVFLSAREGATVLQREDEFLSNLSPFDRQARMQVADPVCQQQFVAFLGRQTLDWEEADQARLRASWAGLQTRLASLDCWPAQIQLIHSTGLEEGQAPYTRGTAIVLPSQVLPGEKLELLLAHELFHVLSRARPELRAPLYALLHFEPSPVPRLEPSVLRITNPDAPTLDWAWRDGERLLTPVLVASRAYSPSDGAFFSLMQLRLVDARHPEQLLPVAEVPAYALSFNTHYIIHPDEILANNFMLWGEPGLPQQIQTILEGWPHG